MNIRPATENDMQSAFEWRNDAVTISNLRTKREIKWDGHKKWFPETLAREDARILMSEIRGDPFGIIYFERLASDVWATHVNSSPEFRGQGLAVPMLAMALDWLHERENADIFSTIIKDGNIPAIKMYNRCGFRLIWPTSDGFSIYATPCARDGRACRVRA